MSENKLVLLTSNCQNFFICEMNFNNFDIKVLKKFDFPILRFYENTEHYFFEVIKKE